MWVQIDIGFLFEARLSAEFIWVLTVFGCKHILGGQIATDTVLVLDVWAWRQSEVHVCLFQIPLPVRERPPPPSHHQIPTLPNQRSLADWSCPLPPLSRLFSRWIRSAVHALRTHVSWCKIKAWELLPVCRWTRLLTVYWLQVQRPTLLLRLSSPLMLWWAFHTSQFRSKWTFSAYLPVD